MADERTYIKVHDGMPDHWKIEALSDRAFRLLIETWCWCSRHLNDGRFPESSWKRRGTAKARKEIEDSGLVEIVDGRVVMHDYLEHQRSSGQVEEIREKKRRSAALANHTRWHVGRSKVDPGCEFCRPDSDPDGSPDRIPDGSGPDRTTDNGRNPSEAEAEKRTTKGSGTPASGTSSASAKPRANGRAKADLEALAGSAHSPAAHRLVQDFATTRAQRPPARVLAQLGPLVDELLEQDWPADLVARSLTAWGDKGLDPARLHSVANEVANRKPVNGTGAKRTTTDDRIAEFVGAATPTPPQLTGGTA